MTIDGNNEDEYTPFPDEWGQPNEVETGSLGISIDGEEPTIADFQIGMYDTGSGFGFVKELEGSENIVNELSDKQLLAITHLRNLTQNAARELQRRKVLSSPELDGGMIIEDINDLPPMLRESLEKNAPDILEKLEKDLEQNGRVELHTINAARGEDEDDNRGV